MFHLAAVVSGQAEADTDLGYRVNLDGTRAVLDACRALGTCPRVVFASSLAVYGGALPPTVGDDTPLTPQTSYGTQKAIGELLVNDYSRKGFVDGRALRLPTVVVRPGSAEPRRFDLCLLDHPRAAGREGCGVPGLARHGDGLGLAAPGRRGARIMRTTCPATRFGANRSLQLPGFSVAVGEMVRGGAPRRRRRGPCPDPLAARPGDPGDRRRLAAGAGRAAAPRRSASPPMPASTRPSGPLSRMISRRSGS